MKNHTSTRQPWKRKVLLSMKYKNATAIFLTGKDKTIQEKVKNPKSSNTDGIIISFWIFGKVSVTRDESVLTRCGKTKLSNISNNVTRRNSWASWVFTPKSGPTAWIPVLKIFVGKTSPLTPMILCWQMKTWVSLSVRTETVGKKLPPTGKNTWPDETVITSVGRNILC